MNAFISKAKIIVKPLKYTSNKEIVQEQGVNKNVRETMGLCHCEILPTRKFTKQRENGGRSVRTEGKHEKYG